MRSSFNFWLSLVRPSLFFALKASFPAESINIAKVRLERPLSNETALARTWISLRGAFLALMPFTTEKVLATSVQ